MNQRLEVQSQGWENMAHSIFRNKKPLFFSKMDRQIHMYTYTHQHHHTQLRRLFIHLTQVFKKTSAHKIFNQIMIKLRRDKYDLGYGLVYPPTEQTFMEHILCTRYCARFGGFVSHQQGSQHCLQRVGS